MATQEGYKASVFVLFAGSLWDWEAGHLCLLKSHFLPLVLEADFIAMKKLWEPAHRSGNPTSQFQICLVYEKYIANRYVLFAQPAAEW